VVFFIRSGASHGMPRGEVGLRTAAGAHRAPSLSAPPAAITAGRDGAADATATSGTSATSPRRRWLRGRCSTLCAASSARRRRRAKRTGPSVATGPASVTAARVRAASARLTPIRLSRTVLRLARSWTRPSHQRVPAQEGEDGEERAATAGARASWGHGCAAEADDRGG
jgi:hypothetical protein